MSVVAALFGTNSQPLTAFADPELAHGSRSGAGTCFTSGVTAYPIGGVAPYTYSWAKVSGDTFTIGTASAAGTSFNVVLSFGDFRTAIYRCTITDSLGATATCDVSVTALEVSFF